MAIFSIVIALVLIALDQWSKLLALRYLVGKGTVVLIPGFMGLKYVENTGAAFSILSNSTDFLIIITSVALVILAYLLFVKGYGDKFERFCFMLIFAGGVGNLIDRVMRGFVVDYFEVLFMNFAVFNVADVYVCTGIGLYTLYTFYTEYYLKKKEKD